MHTRILNQIDMFNLNSSEPDFNTVMFKSWSYTCYCFVADMVEFVASVYGA